MFEVALQSWLEEIGINDPFKYRQSVIANALILLQRLKSTYSLNPSRHLSVGGLSVKGATVKAVSKILNKFEEKRPFAKEGGYSSWGGAWEMEAFLESLEKLKLDNQPQEERNKILTSFQSYLVDRVRDYHNRQKIRFYFDSKQSTWQTVASLLETAKSEGKTGYVAQHLVGAKLQLRYPHLQISNESASTADQQTKRQGDFIIGDTVFHVTVAPMQGVYLKCKQNLAEGLKVYLLVIDSKLIGARQTAEEYCGKQISVESIESFVSQNIDEISVFESGKLKSSIVELIKIYNRRVDEVETDKSLLIELPSNLT